MSFNLENFLPYKLSLTSNTVSEHLSKVYSEYSLTRTQWRVMAVLSMGGVTAGKIAKKTLMDKATISRAVKVMIVRGLLTRRASQEDGRASPLKLTTKGRKIFENIAPKAIQAEKDIFQRLSKEQRITLEHLLDILLA
ncbi:MAG: MarR family transcriptional regulator [Robiginitomaculum sp.]